MQKKLIIFSTLIATELSAVAEKYPVFKKLGVEIFSMSIDSVFVHKMWNDHELSKMVKGGIPFPMLSDTGERWAQYMACMMIMQGLKQEEDSLLILKE